MYNNIYTFERLLSKPDVKKGENIILAIDDTYRNLGKKDLINVHIYDSLHSHDYIELAYAYSGIGIQYVNGVRFAVQKGDVICLNIGDSHYYEPLENFQVLNCIILPDALPGLKQVIPENLLENKRLALPVFIRMDVKNHTLIDLLFHKMEQEYKLKHKNYETSIRAALAVIVSELLHTSENRSETPNINASMWHVLEYISANLANNIRLSDAAKIGGYSAPYFSKIFHEYMGVSFIRYVNNLKINKAKFLLATTNRPVIDICFESGFNEKKHFYTVFRNFMQCTPNQFRDMARK